MILDNLNLCYKHEREVKHLHIHSKGSKGPLNVPSGPLNVYPVLREWLMTLNVSQLIDFDLICSYVILDNLNLCYKHERLKSIC